jgi:threonine/homoserine/homoserine lactone efflux protein
MELAFLLKGIAVGFTLAVPIGPIGILCIKRTMVDGSREGLLVGLSAASADVLYAAVAAFGVSFISNFIHDQQHLIRLAGGLLILSIGVHTFRSAPTLNASPNTLRTTTSAFVSIFLLALTNPLTLFGFAAVLSGLGVNAAAGNSLSIVYLLAGVFAGSLLWFTLITGLVSLFKEKVGARGLAFTNKLAGSLLIAIGVVAVWSGLKGL